MNNKFGHDDGYERWFRGPDREFDTSARYQEPYGHVYTGAQPDHASAPYSSAPRSYGSNPGPRHAPRGGFSGLGPKGYTRADDRIFEEVCERLSWNDEVDATDISVRVADGEVTLVGSVDTRHMKRVAEQLAEHVLGVRDVLNTLRVQKTVRSASSDGGTEEGHEREADASTRANGHG